MTFQITSWLKNIMPLLLGKKKEIKCQHKEKSEGILKEVYLKEKQTYNVKTYFVSYRVERSQKGRGWYVEVLSVITINDLYEVVFPLEGQVRKKNVYGFFNKFIIKIAFWRPI